MNEFRRCKFCGRVVIFDDARHIAAHEGPPCEEWSKLLARLVALGAMRELSPELHEVPDELPATTGLASTEPRNGKEKDN